jgi:hypothetical protein
MASLFDSIRDLIHSTADGLINEQVTTKVSDMYTGFISAGMGVVNDTIKIVRDISAPPAPPPAPPPGP